LPSLDDREHLESSLGCAEVRGDGVSGLVRCDDLALSVRVCNGVRETDLFREPGSLHIAPVQLPPPVAQGPNQRFVEDMLEHRGRISEGHRREFFAQVHSVHIFCMGSPFEEVVDELSPACPGRQIEVEGAIESARP
jgi:hypothetical protein